MSSYQLSFKLKSKVSCSIKPLNIPGIKEGGFEMYFEKKCVWGPAAFENHLKGFMKIFWESE